MGWLATYRDDFAAATIGTLARRSGYRCSRPDCRASTSGPATKQDRAVNLGVAGHITAAAPGGPRYYGSLTGEQRRDIANAIWLCQSCRKLVDSDTNRFSVEELRQWKAAAEASAGRELGTPQGPAGGFAVLERKLTGHTNYVWDVIVTPDGRRAVSASNDRTAALWDLHTGQRLCVYRGADAEVCSVALSPDGNYLAGGFLNGEVLVWRVDAPDPLRKLHHGAADAKVAWSGGKIVTGGRDGWLRRWGPGGALLQERAVHNDAVLKVSCLDDGRVATASEDGAVRLWSVT